MPLQADRRAEGDAVGVIGGRDLQPRHGAGRDGRTRPRSVMMPVNMTQLRRREPRFPGRPGRRRMRSRRWKRPMRSRSCRPRSAIAATAIAADDGPGAEPVEPVDQAGPQTAPRQIRRRSRPAPGSGPARPARRTAAARSSLPSAPVGDLQEFDALFPQAIGAACRPRRGRGSARSAPRRRTPAPSAAAAGYRSRTIRTGERSSRPGEAAGELGIVGGHGAGADQDGVMGGAQQVGRAAGPRAGDPLAVAVGQGDPAVQRGGQLQRHHRPALRHARQEARH